MITSVKEVPQGLNKGEALTVSFLIEAANLKISSQFWVIFLKLIVPPICSYNAEYPVNALRKIYPKFRPLEIKENKEIA